MIQPPRKTQCDWHNLFLSSALLDFILRFVRVYSYPELVLKFTLTKSAAGTEVV